MAGMQRAPFILEVAQRAPRSTKSTFDVPAPWQSIAISNIDNNNMRSRRKISLTLDPISEEDGL